MQLLLVLVFLVSGLSSALAGQSLLLSPSPSPSPTNDKVSAAKLSVTPDLPISQQPFWRAKPELKKKMTDERAILVSVKREDLVNGLTRFTINAGGIVAQEKDRSFAIAQHYSELKTISEHFKTAEYNPVTHQLFLVTEALGYQARMMLEIIPVSEDWRSELQWKVVWGHFKGMSGVIGYERVKENGNSTPLSKKTEVSIHGLYEGKDLPLPKILMGFALEVIVQKVAEKMRTFIEHPPVHISDPEQQDSANPVTVQIPSASQSTLSTSPRH